MYRLFDIVEKNAREFPDEVIFGKKEGGIWKKMYYKDVILQINNLANSIIELIGFPKSYTPEDMEKIAIISNNRPEWLITDMAVQEAGAILTPIYPTVSVSDLEFILNDASIKIIFVSNQEIYDRFKSVLDKDAYKIYSFDKLNNIENWESLLIQRSTETKLEQSKQNISEDTLATLIYTSGTTGQPKGVMLTHKNIMSNVKDCMPCFNFANSFEKALSFLPLNHIFEKTLSYIYLYKVAAIYYAENLETIGDNLREVQPVVFTCVPRVLEKVYSKIVSKGSELKGIKRSIFFWALNLAKKYDNHTNFGIWYNLQLKVANKLVFSKWREALGNNVKAIVSGSAALNPDLIRIFTAANVIILEGYGLTETSPVISVNRFENKDRVIGTVGPVIQNVEVRIAEDGEIWCKGNNVMMGYYKNPKATEEVMTEDGWFKTGDIGTIVDNKYLKITDRKKEIFKTSGGKYVAPQFIENMYRSVNVISQLMVVGDGKKFVSALIVPDWDQVALKLNNGKSIDLTSRKEWLHKPELIQLIQKGIEYMNPKINHVEQIKKFHLLADDWTVDNGILTPKLSLKRKVVLEKFHNEIEDLYKE